MVISRDFYARNCAEYEKISRESDRVRRSVSDRSGVPGLSGEDSLARWISMSAVPESAWMADGEEWAVGMRQLPPPNDSDRGDHFGGNAETVASLVFGNVVDRE